MTAEAASDDDNGNVYELKKYRTDRNYDTSMYVDDESSFGGGGGGDMWQQSVETRLSELRGDIQGLRTEMSGEFRSIRDRQDRDFRLLFGAVIATALGIAGLMARGFGWIG